MFYAIWSEDDKEYVGLCKRYPLLSHLDPDRDEALKGIEDLVKFIEEEDLDAGKG